MARIRREDGWQIAIAAVTAFALMVQAVRAGAAAVPDRVYANDFGPATRGCFGGATEPMSLLRATASRSPSGLLNARPPAPEAPFETMAGWAWSGCAEIGGLASETSTSAGDGNGRAALSRSYPALDSAGLAGSFRLAAERTDSARFIEALGGNVGRDDRHVGLRLGRYNDWTLGAFYRETPYVYTSTYRSLWHGVGSGDLRLASPALPPGGLPAADATQAALRGVLASLPDSTLEIVRRGGGLALDARLSEAWRAFVSLSSERRRGARPLGAAFGGGDGGGNVDVPESIDDTTHELRAGVSHADAVTSFSLALSASSYRNRIGTMTFDNPLTATLGSIAGVGPDALTRGRYDLAPDNDYTNAQADFARHWPQLLGARLTVSASLGRMRQNDALVAPTTLALAGGTLNGIATDNAWNSTAALTRTSADARIDTKLLALALTVNPVRALVVGTRYRHYATDNRTAAYFACNPLTGQVGRLLNDGSGAAVADVPAWLGARCDAAAIRALALVPDAGNVVVRNTPHEHTQRVLAVSADWRIGRTSSLSAEAEREEFRRPLRERERERTEEDTLRLAWTQRGFDRERESDPAAGSAASLLPAMLRVSFVYGERRGSAYRTALAGDSLADPYSDLVSASLGPLPATGNVTSWIRGVETFHRFDLADRRQGRVDLRAHFALAESLDAGVSLGGRYAVYPHSEFGRRGRNDSSSASVDVNYLAASGLQLHGFLSHQWARLQQRGVQPAACVIGSNGVTAANFGQFCAGIGGPLFPGDRLWAVSSRDRHLAAGAGAQFELRRAVLEVDYLYTRSLTAIDYGYGTGIVLTPAERTLAGSAWPDLKFTQQVVSVGALVPLARNLAARLTLQHERGSIEDWHYAGVAANPAPAVDAVYLDSGPRDYRATFVGVLLRLKL